jgi:hypothetical protein
MEKRWMLCAVAMVVSVVMFSGCELLPLLDGGNSNAGNRDNFVSTGAQVKEADDLKAVAVGALNAAKDAAINVGLEWTAGRIAATAGEATGWGGVIAFALMAYRSMRRKDGLLKSTGQVIEAFTRAEPEAGGSLKASLAKEAARLPVDAKKEFGV